MAKGLLSFINGNKLVKPIYFPMYCDYRYRWSYFKKINTLSREVITTFMDNAIIDIPLIWDGGNLVSNGEYGLLTSKVIEDNPTFNRYYIERIIEDYLDVKPVIIPRQKEDVIGHVDGYASFINKKTLAISKYPNMAFLQEDNVYLEELVSQVQNSGLETIRVFDRPVDQNIRCNCKKKKRSGCYSVSKGIYINNLILNDTVILPQYSLPTKRETIFYNQANREIYEHAGYKVESVNCDLLSQFGGSLHCLSYTH
ncbi:agmatine deiminase family protein [Sphingobacterium corticis]|uniref:Agmatine deiminase family protein n=1 Tax=Sphingobacterium corticis TaxID=1812823 RepID=A0ABW5NJ40_9SPHI